MDILKRDDIMWTVPESLKDFRYPYNNKFLFSLFAASWCVWTPQTEGDNSSKQAAAASSHH